MGNGRGAQAGEPSQESKDKYMAELQKTDPKAYEVLVKLEKNIQDRVVLGDVMGAGRRALAQENE